MEPGQKVIIRQNPHHPGAENIVGTVTVFRPGEGFAGCDLVDVHYKNPRDGKGYTMPFGMSCLGPADPGSLIALAEHYEAMAAKLRELAIGTSSSK
jgi:hypothetical protein